MLYPVIRNRLSSILRRIGIISFFITALSIVFLILELVQNNYGDVVAIKYVTIIFISISRGLLTILLFSAMLKLVCAQAPYNTRGLFGGCMVLVLLSSLIIGFYTPSNNTLSIYRVRVGISVLGFILYCLLAGTRGELETRTTMHTVLVMLSSDFLFLRFLVVPPANPSNFSHCKCFFSRMYIYSSLMQCMSGVLLACNTPGWLCCDIP